MRLLARAKRETGCRSLSENPELMGTFRMLPDDLELIEDRIHDMRAKAELCVGTDQSVGVILFGMLLSSDCVLLICCSQVVVEYKDRERRIEKLSTEVCVCVCAPM